MKSNDNPKLAFAFFGMQYNPYIWARQLDEIKKYIKKSTLNVNFILLDCTREGINQKEFEREKLLGYKDEKEIDERFDPLAKFRKDSRRKLTGGQTYATIYLQCKDFNDLSKKREDIDFIFRLRLDVIVDHRLIEKAINKVIEPNIKSPFKIFKHKAWVQFFNLVDPFFIFDTAFLISRIDLKALTDESLKSGKYYKPNSHPTILWGPLFYKNNIFLSTLAAYFFNESPKEPNLNWGSINLLPLYWKYIYANFYVDFSPEVFHYFQWNPNKRETRTWLKIEKENVKNLSLRNIAFIHRFFACSYMEENLTYSDILKISRNRDFSIKLIKVLTKIIYKFVFLKFSRLILKFNLNKKYD